MDVFFSLLVNMLPLYAVIALGYIAGRVLKADKQTMASLAIYIFIPIMVFGFVSDMDFKPGYITLPVFYYIACVITGIIFYTLGKHTYNDNHANLVTLCTSMGNAGYFGLPIALFLFGDHGAAIYIFMMFGLIIYQATMGYYVAVRSNFDVRTSLVKLLKFPAIYAMAAGMIVNLSGYELPEMFWTYWTHAKGCYVIIGMMIIGVVLGGIKKLVFDPKFISLVFAGKFLIMPLLGALFIWLDSMTMHILTEELRQMVVLITIVPPAANSVAYAAQLDIRPEKAATTVLAGTIFALFYIPAIVWLTGM